MKRRAKGTSFEWFCRRESCERAARDLRVMAADLREYGALNAARAVRRALKSVDGARRHADGRLIRSERS
jgi:hypothetical protein